MQRHVSAPGKDLVYHECAEKNAILLLQQDALEGMQKKNGLQKAAHFYLV